ncbi:Methyl farnesoate epoxidase, partial [Orchesella cincta]
VQGQYHFWVTSFKLRNNPLEVFQNWAKDAIIISDPKLVTELFSDINSTGRPFHPLADYFGKGHGIVTSQGHIWAAQRSFTVRKLRDFGLLRSSNETSLLADAEALISFFEHRVGKPISGLKLFNGPVINGLWKIISGESCNLDSETKPEIVKRTECLLEIANKTSVLYFAPFLRHIAPNFFEWTNWTNAVDSIFELTRKSVKKHTQQMDENNPQDFIDHYLLKIRATTDPSSTFYQENGMKNLEAIVNDVIGAGSDSTSVTLSFATLYLLLNQDAQRNAQQELDRVVGSSRQVSLSDKNLLPYTRAVILETLRLSSIAPLGIAHQMLTDTIFHGYLFPKDVMVIAGLYTIHHDVKLWGDDVNEFRPERFLNEDKTKLIPHPALMPFCVGRRACLGENLARDNLFIFLASILQRFNIEPDPECPVLKVETQTGVAVEPKPFKFMLSLRN